MNNWEFINKKDTNSDIYITLLVDRSGSMISMGNGVYNGIKTFISDQKKNAEENSKNIYLTIKSFDDKVEVVQEILEKNIDTLDPEKITKDNITPRNSTRLIDTAIEELEELEKKINNNKELTGIFALLTDGKDNVSNNSEVDLNKLILKLRDNINCIFLGANQDAISQGSKYGFTREQSLTYTSKGTTSENAMRSLSSNISRISAGKKVGFTDLERINSK